MAFYFSIPCLTVNLGARGGRGETRERKERDRGGGETEEEEERKRRSAGNFDKLWAWRLSSGDVNTACKQGPMLH